MISNRDGHVRQLPQQTINEIAAGEVIERPASVVKELVENSIDAGATRIDIAVTKAGSKLVSVRDNGCGMSRADALLSLENHATSKIRASSDITFIDTLGFRGEAVPSIASVSRFSLTTRTADSDEGTFLQVNAGVRAEIRAAGCPVGTLVEVRDLFCNVPARRRFLKAYVTEEGHVKNVFVAHALAHPNVGFSLTIDGRRLYALAPATTVRDRIRDLFGDDFLAQLLPLGGVALDASADGKSAVRVSGFIERPNLSTPTRRDQYIFVNGRPATATAVNYALREAYPRRAGDMRPAVFLFIDVAPEQVDVNVHPTKREVRFRDQSAVKRAITDAVAAALSGAPEPVANVASVPNVSPVPVPVAPDVAVVARPGSGATTETTETQATPKTPATVATFETPAPSPVQHEISFAVDPESPRARPWKWFNYLAQSASGYLLIETDSGLVTINPQAARERIAYEQLLAAAETARPLSQALLIPETVPLSPVDAARIGAALETITRMGFQIEPFGTDTFKVDAVPQILGAQPTAPLLATIARDLAEGGGARRTGERWREELVAKSIARAYAGASLALTKDGATRLVEELCACRMPYVCPRGKPVLIFTSTRELDRKFNRA